MIAIVWNCYHRLLFAQNEPKNIKSDKARRLPALLSIIEMGDGPAQTSPLSFLVLTYLGASAMKRRST